MLKNFDFAVLSPEISGGRKILFLKKVFLGRILHNVDFFLSFAGLDTWA